MGPGRRVSLVLGRAFKRLRVNIGRAAPETLARVIQTAGGSAEVILCAKRLRCSVRPKLARPSKTRP
eukprot:7710415-Lingulodinium_polyedra.AAC.1